ncbi:MAG: glutathione peroxidase [Acidobacteria bacterium]|nr:glutathione peroxidase [Acidobacteriota bacterium]MCB9396717.1 glutathione peroxidase [Acidobacteriota bacterium]
MDFYSLNADRLQGQTTAMETFRGQVVLVVNTASKCGFTPQYAGLQELYQTFKDQGFTILGFPCNQFLGQEPGGVKEIEETCLVNYGVSFPMFAKIEVNGPNTHPVFKYLKDQLPGLLGGRIKWNFTKFLIGRDGKPLKRYAPRTKPEALVDDIQAALKKA